MAVESESQATRRRTPFGARLPQMPINEAEKIARGLHDLAGDATAPVLAQHLDASPSSSGFKTRLAAAGYYGLVTRSGNRYDLTERGRQVVSGTEEESRRARQQGVMATNFAIVLRQFSGRAVNEEIIGARLHLAFDVPRASTLQLAKALTESARQAGLLNGGRFDARAIEEAGQAVEQYESVEVAKAEDQAGREQPPTTKAETKPARKAEQAGNKGGSAAAQRPFSIASSTASSIGPAIHLHLSLPPLSVEEIVELIRRVSDRPRD